jgi:hypothetical protein
MASFLTQIHGHGQLQFEQDGLQRDVQLPVACQFHYGGVKSAVRVVALQFICRTAHSFQGSPDWRERGHRVGDRERQRDGVAFEHVPQGEQLQDVRRRLFGDAGTAARATSLRGPTRTTRVPSAG